MQVVDKNQYDAREKYGPWKDDYDANKENFICDEKVHDKETDIGTGDAVENVLIKNAADKDHWVNEATYTVKEEHLLEASKDNILVVGTPYLNFFYE